MTPPSLPLAIAATKLNLVGAFVALLFIGIVVWYGILVYNRLVRAEERVDNAWADVDVVLKQRRDALQKLTDAVRQAMDYEESLLKEIVDARERVSNAETPKEEAAADAKVREALKHLRVRAEDHPELQAVGNLGDLQDEIATLEEQIADRREVYNEEVTTLNTLLRSIPYVFYAQVLPFSSRELFEAPESQTADVDVDAMLNGDRSKEAH